MAEIRACIATIPIRPEPTIFPPFGSIAVIQALRQVDVRPEFYHLDYWRHSWEEIERFFAEKQFDLVGVSAVVSTSYSYTKRLVGVIHRVSPHTVIVLGGNMAASAEVILRKTAVEICIQGDGERIIQNFVRHIRKETGYEDIRAIKGLCYLDEKGEFVFTGYETAISAAELEFPDFTILEEAGCLDHYVPRIPQDEFLTSEKGRRWAEEGYRETTVITEKGCIARCTFCHRFEKGFRQLPPASITDHIRFLMDHYRVRFIDFADENFGSDKKATAELVAQLADLDVLWRVCGVRVTTVDLDTLRSWKAAGCVAVYYGIESGSQTILDVMEKRATVQRNIDVLRWTHEAGLFTTVQLVLAMPGETHRTIGETTEFLKTVTVYRPRVPSFNLSNNYAQSLPGTALYEYARSRGVIGKTLDAEEAYLEAISNIDASTVDHFVNYTQYPMLDVVAWRIWMVGEVEGHYFQTRLAGPIPFFEIFSFAFGTGLSLVFPRLVSPPENPLFVRMKRERPGAFEKIIWGWDTRKAEGEGYYNIQRSALFLVSLVNLNPILRRANWPMVLFFLAVKRVAKNPRRGLAEVGEWILHHTGQSLRRLLGRPTAESSAYLTPQKSLRTLMKEISEPPARSMDLVRLGR